MKCRECDAEWDGSGGKCPACGALSPPRSAPGESDDGHGPQFTLKFKDVTRHPQSVRTAGSDGPGSSKPPRNDTETPEYRLKKPKFQPSEEQLENARQIVAVRERKRGCRQSVVVALLLALAAAAAVALWYNQQRPEKPESAPPSAVAVGEDSILLSLHNTSHIPVAVKIGRQVYSLRAEEILKIAVRRGAYDISWTGVFAGGTIYDIRAGENLARDTAWSFVLETSGAAPALVRKSE